MEEVEHFTQSTHKVKLWILIVAFMNHRASLLLLGINYSTLLYYIFFV